MSRLFGTDGMRGVANIAPMDSDTVLALGRALAQVMRRNKGRHSILIGKDTRLSGYLIETAVASGISSMGVDVLLVGPLPTPGVAFMTRSMRADAGVVISASHNPYEDNGIKIFGPDGFKLPDEVEDEIEHLMFAGKEELVRAKPEEVGKAFRIDDAVGRYTVSLKSILERTCKLDGLKLVVDTANGAAYKVAPMVFRELGAQVICVGNEPDGRNINRGVGSLHPEVIVKLTQEHKAHCGIAFDGDADRVVLCDEHGQILDGDFILAMLAIEMKKKGLLKNNTVVGTVMSNLGLEKCLEQQGINFVRSAVGDRYVLSEMIEHGSNLGGEQSGHIIVMDYNTTGDGTMAALLVLAQMLATGQPLSDYRKLMKRYPQVIINIPVARKVPFEEINSISAELKDAEEKLSSSGRVLLRYSGTEKKARVMVEAEDEYLCELCAQRLAETVKVELS
ncbi:MAG: phosphoglucosamine mutase [Deltaproteobacteria bacterium]|nr:phosphoglucosamine mutase [Deltaproteobacteria bacterium]